MKLRIYVDLFRPQGGFSSYSALHPITKVPREGDTVTIEGMRFELQIVRHYDNTDEWSTYIRIDGAKVRLEPVRRKLLASGFTLLTAARRGR